MSDVVDMNVLDTLAGEVGAENIGMIIEMFCNDSAARVSTINEAVEQRSLSVISAQCHAIKGGAMSVGAMALGQQMQQAESAAKAGDVESSINALLGFESLYQETVEKLSQFA